jgi:uncharacterized protein (TIGR02996 family)
VTTEDDFQAQLDADPTDWQTRLVFADWLQERDDRRAEGYRALGALRYRPWRSCGGTSWWNWSRYGSPITDLPSQWDNDAGELPGDWFAAVVGDPPPSVMPEIFVGSRRAADDAAARAFAKLPAARRTELLATEPTVTA